MEDNFASGEASEGAEWLKTTPKEKRTYYIIQRERGAKMAQLKLLPNLILPPSEVFAFGEIASVNTADTGYQVLVQGTARTWMIENTAK